MSVVPIVRSGGVIDYKALMPKYSYIDTYDYASPKELADYLRYLDSNDTAFIQYFTWKKDFLLADYENNICDFCAKLNEPIKPKIYHDIYEFFVNGTDNGVGKTST